MVGSYTARERVISAVSFFSLTRRGWCFFFSGTTTLLYAFKDHSEISISERENCQIARPLQQDDINLKRLGMDLAELLPGKKRGIKCPDTLKNFKAIHRLVQHSPDCQFIIGLRHPMTQLQSFYNYRITEIYDKHLPKEDIPDLLDILTERHPPWKDVSIDSSRFELYLLQFGKTNMTIDDLELLMNNKMLAIRPNHFPIFLYTLDQINDADEHRSRQFRKDLQQFMGLSSPLQPLGHENLNHFVGQKAHKETADICQERFDTIRKTLVENSQTTAAWIRNVFLQSPEVTISNRAHFLQSLESWNEDPCTQ